MKSTEEHATWCPAKTGELTVDGKIEVVVKGRDGRGTIVRRKPQCGCHLSPTAQGLRRLKERQAELKGEAS